MQQEEYIQEQGGQGEQGESRLPTPRRQTRHRLIPKRQTSQKQSASKPSLVSTQHQNNSTHSSQAQPSIHSFDEGTLLADEVRIKGQQKLLYLKQCHSKSSSAESIFKNYPFSDIDLFTFDHHALRDEHNHLTASIIQDQTGVHLVQQHTVSKSKPQKYVNAEDQPEESSFNGLAVSILTNGNIFEGIYHNGKSCGLGYQLQANGNIFIGTFKDGVKNGNGTFYWFTNDELYIGEWQGDLPHGLGIYLGKDRYEGAFLNGLKFGFGEESFCNGDKYAGEYVNSVVDGYGEYCWEDQSVYKGDFKQGVRHGYGIWENGNEMYKGCYRLDKKEGYGLYVWKGKQVYKGEFRDDFREGYGQFYSIKQDSETMIYKGRWVKGKKYEQGKVDSQQVSQLHSFLQDSRQLDKTIAQNSKKEKQRVGHRNCIPKESYPRRHR